MVIRLLLYAVLAWLVWRGVRKLLLGGRSAHLPQPRPGAAAAPSGPSSAQPEAMLACRHCGVYVPEEAAVRVAGRSYCSMAHAQIYEDA